MALVTIIGSGTPCVELPSGEVRTVAHTDHVQRLIDRGYVEVLDWVDDDEPGLTDTEQEADRQAVKARRKTEAVAVSDTAQAQLIPGGGGGADRADRGDSDPVHVAAEGAAADRAVDPPGA